MLAPAGPAHRGASATACVAALRIERDLATIIGWLSLAIPSALRHAGTFAADFKAFKSGARITARSYPRAVCDAHGPDGHRSQPIDRGTSFADRWDQSSS